MAPTTLMAEGTWTSVRDSAARESGSKAPCAPRAFVALEILLHDLETVLAERETKAIAHGERQER